MGAIPKNDDFNHLMKDLLMKDHFVKGFYTLCKTIVFNVKRAPQRERHGCHSQKYGTLSIIKHNTGETGDNMFESKDPHIYIMMMTLIV